MRHILGIDEAGDVGFGQFQDQAPEGLKDCLAWSRISENGLVSIQTT